MDEETASEPNPALEEASRTIAEIGKRIRKLRQERGVTLQYLAEKADLSPSMLSLVERGMTSPSLMSLAALAHALGTNLSDLISGRQVSDDEIVSRFSEQPLIETSDHVLRRVLKEDRKRKVKITFNEYGPNIGNNPKGITHSGYEYGLCLEGELTVEVEGVPYVLRNGDLISLKSSRLHKIWNYGKRPAQAIWFNLDIDH